MGWQIEVKTSKGWEFFTKNDDDSEGSTREELARTLRADPVSRYRMVDVPDDEDEQDDGEPATYRVTRKYFDDDMESEVIATGLTLEEAQEHCEDPETSSSTATEPEGVARTELYGPWFDRYTEE